MSRTGRFFRRGVSKVYAVTTMAGSTPTLAEINAGLDLSDKIASIAGFAINNTPITTPDLGDAYDGQIDGVDATETSSFTLYDETDDSATRPALAKGTNITIVLMPYGKTTSKRMETYKTRVTGCNDTWSTDAAAAQYVVGFAILSRPNQNASVPSV